MDINALRVFDSLFKLELSDEDYAELEEEQKHTERTGVYIHAVKKGYSVCVSHDQKHKIIVHKISYNHGKLPFPKSRILLKTLVTFKDLPQQIYTLHQIAQYHALDSKIKYVAKNLDELKDRICDRFADGYPKELGKMYEEVYYFNSDDGEKNKKLRPVLVRDQLEAIFWLFDEKFEEVKVSVARKNIPRIVKVFQRNNRRLAIIQKNEDFDKHRGGIFRSWMEHISRTVFLIKTYKPSNSEYDYCAPGREMYLPGDWNENGVIWLSDELFEKVGPEELKLFSRSMERQGDGREWMFLTADRYNKQSSAMRLEIVAAKRKEQEKQAHTQMKNNIKKQFSKGRVVRQGITFRKESMEYEGIIIRGSLLGKYIAENNILFQEQPDFVKIFMGYVDYVLQPEISHSYRDWSKILVTYKFDGLGGNIQVGNIKVRIRKKGSLFYINDIKIRQLDVGKVVKGAINYEAQDKYDEWLRFTSRVNLDVQKLLKQGAADFELTIDSTDDNHLLKDKRSISRVCLPFRMDGSKFYATINGKDYRIKNTSALLDLRRDVDEDRIRYSGGGHLQRTIKLAYRAIEGISPKEIGRMIMDGKKEYDAMMKRINAEREKKLKKSKEFVAHAVKVTKAEPCSKKIDGVVNKGWLVKGLSKTLYFVTDRGKVYAVKGKKMQYLCIVDDDYDEDGEEWRRNDGIAKRLLALSHDKMVAREIYDNGDHMDNHWLDLVEDYDENDDEDEDDDDDDEDYEEV